MAVPDDDALLAAATAVAANAYAPYSAFHVGAALETESGRTFTGVNVENASYGLTICAERAAIFAAVAAEGSAMRISRLAVVTADGAPAAPCGACRQVLLEFGPDATILFRGRDGIETTTARELLPHAFTLPAA